MLRRSNKKKAPVEVVKPELSRDQAATRIQCMVRRFLANRKIRKVAQQVLVRTFDPVYKQYFWFDKLHETSTWKKPKFLQLYDEIDVLATKNIERIVRGFVGRCKARKIANARYVRYFDSETGRFYWYDQETKKTTYNASRWLQRMNVDMPTEDKLLLQSHMRIKELERKLAEKENEIKQIRVQRYEELEPQVIKDKIKNARNFERSKHMDDWSIDDMAAWFTELKMEQYIPALFTNRVDGALFVNLADEEFHDLGIVNKFHLRKLQLILKAFRIRYQRKKDRKAGRMNDADEDEDELLSEYSPSELSAIIAAEDKVGDDGSDDDLSDDNLSFASEEDEITKLTEEQRLQKRMDEENIHIQVVMRGDGQNFPLIGDIVRVRYVCSLAEDGKVLMSTKNVLERPWVEFVLGIDQVIRGFDRALPLMSIGERSKLTFTPEYAYGNEGLPPHIPPNASITFDLTLLGFRPRSSWVKPLLQDHTTFEKPYHKDLQMSVQLAAKSGMGDHGILIYSSSMLLNDDKLLSPS